MDELLADVARFLAPFRAEGHEVEFELTYYYGWRKWNDGVSAWWWRAQLTKNHDGVAAIERTPDEAVRMALGLAREKAAV